MGGLIVSIVSLLLLGTILIICVWQFGLLGILVAYGIYLALFGLLWLMLIIVGFFMRRKGHNQAASVGDHAEVRLGESEKPTPVMTDGGGGDSVSDTEESSNAEQIRELETELSDAVDKFYDAPSAAIPAYLKNLLFDKARAKLTYLQGFRSSKGHLDEEGIRKTEKLISLISLDWTHPTERELSLISRCERLTVELEAVEKELDYRSGFRGHGYSDDEQEYRAAAMAEYSVRKSLEEALDELNAEIGMRLSCKTFSPNIAGAQR